MLPLHYTITFIYFKIGHNYKLNQNENSGFYFKGPQIKIWGQNVREMINLNESKFTKHFI